MHCTRRGRFWGRAVPSLWVLATSALLLLSGASRASERAGAAPLDAHEIMVRMDQAYYYAGKDMRARVTMEIVSRGGGRRSRVMTVLRLTLPDGRDQKYLVYFHEPGDVRRMTCMVNKHATGSDERWIFVPAVDRVRRIEAPERSSFLASDFVREEFSGRDVEADTHALLPDSSVDGRPCWGIESTPKDGAEYARCDSWIDKQTYLPLMQKFFDGQGQLQRVFTGTRIEEIKSRNGKRYPTLTERRMAAPSGSHWTRIVCDSVLYDTGLKEADFSEEHMKVQLSAWLR
jgi:outer membrane lipoprotein-sorting protein